MPWLKKVLTSLSSYMLLIVTLYPLRLESIEISNFHVPRLAHEGDSLYIICQYKRGVTNLYTHKWYKDGLEFWRYEPGGRPSTMYLQVPDVKISRRESNKTHLLLTDLTANSTGQFTCELSSLPDYHTTYRDAQLQVLPRPAASSSSSTASRLMYTWSSYSIVINLALALVKNLQWTRVGES